MDGVVTGRIQVGDNMPDEGEAVAAYRTAG